MILKNKTVLVTGASRGIGREIVKLFAENGANIAFSYKNPQSKSAALQLAKSIKKKGQQIKAYVSDAADNDSSQELVETVLTDFGNIDICVNNAGISHDSLLTRIDINQWNQILANNLTSVYLITKNLVRPMLKAKGGNIINISSIVGIHGNAWQSSYAASKAGIIGFTKSIAAEYGKKNIRCNAIAPGFIETDMTRYLVDNNISNKVLESISLGRFGKPSDVANLALFLASDASSYITGQIISVCGGLSK